MNKCIYLAAKCKTLAVCPVNSFTFAIDGYFHKHNWFCENPCDDKSSFSLFDQTNEHTCEPVSIEFKQLPVLPFQNLIHLSAVPPPDAKTFL